MAVTFPSDDARLHLGLVPGALICALLVHGSARGQASESAEHTPAQVLAVALAESAPPPAAPVATSAPKTEGENRQQELMYRIILTGYEPNYFITGFSRESAVKFQLSVKLDLWPNPSQHSLYFGYTQKSIWKMYDDPGGISDSNHAPELFYGYFKRVGDIALHSGQVKTFIHATRLGLQHESNGRTGEDVRSWNRLYGHLAGSAYLGTDHHFSAALEAWWPFLLNVNNTDIADFLGYGKVAASYGYGFAPSSCSWCGAVSVGGTYFHGWTLEAHQGLEAFLEWRPGYGDGVSWWRFTPNFYAQLYSGHGEHLLAYDQAQTTLRVGISIEDRVYWVNGAH